MAEIDYSGYRIDDWCNAFSNVAKGSWEGEGPAYAWLRFVETATSSVAESTRLEDYSNLVESLGDAFGWLCRFAALYQENHQDGSFIFKGDLSQMIWGKYSGVCYRCAHKFTKQEIKGENTYLACVCLSTPDVSQGEKQLATENRKFAKKSKKRPNTLDEWTEMTKIIYGPNHREISLSSICLHFLEEVGEVAENLRKLRELDKNDTDKRDKYINDLQDEMADVFSWIMGLVNKVDQIFEMGRNYYFSHGIKHLPGIQASTVALNALQRWEQNQS